MTQEATKRLATAVKGIIAVLEGLPVEPLSPEEAELLGLLETALKRRALIWALASSQCIDNQVLDPR